MKKFLLLAALVVSSLSAMATDLLTAKLNVAEGNQEATLSVCLNNTQTFIAFQMDVTLPEGSYTNDDAVMSARLINGQENTLGPTDFVIATNWVSSNVIRLVGYNLGNKEITGTPGEEIFSIKIKKTGEPLSSPSAWTATFDAAKELFVERDNLTEVQVGIDDTPTNTNGNVVSGEVDSAWLPGDIDHSGTVDVTDVTLAIDLAMSNTPVGKYFVEQADVVGDGDGVDVSDVTWIIDEALHIAHE